MKTVWEKYKDSYKPIMDFAEGYKSFITSAKTEREQVTNSIALAEKYGYKNLDTVKEVKAGDKVYINNRGKSLCLFVIGEKDIEEGLNILGAHVDSPRIDIKQNPLYEDNGICLLDTHY